MKTNVNKNIPVIFQNIKQYENEDERFVKVKIWLMHTGENLNGSVFTKTAVEKALPTLANTPILAFIEENSAGDLDYSDHRMILHRDVDGEYSVKYLGQAVGMIPENNNAQWEKRVADNGEELEYLTVEGLMWTKWNDPIDIIKRKGFTAQSMELSDQYTGHFNKDGLFEFEEFKFFGACLLGDSGLPAMRNSTVEMQFSANSDMRKIIEDKLNEFNTLFSTKQGGNEEVEETKQEFETEVETTETQVEDTQVESTEEVVETKVVNEETTVVEEFTEETQSTETTEDVKDEETQESDTDEVKKDFETETVEETQTETTEQVEESVTEEPQVNEFEVKFNDLTEKFNTLQSELEDLRNFKRETLEKELSAKFEGQLTDEELAQVFEQSKDSTIEDIEKELFALVGKKNFSAFSAQPSTKIALNVKKEVDTTPNSPYGDLFKKHLAK